MLGKTLPSNFGDTFPDLKHLCLDNNNFEGHLPASLGNISRLRLLNFSSNNFIGQVPGSFGNLARLQYLILQRNNFWGFIPIELGDLKQLTHLDLSDNNLQGGVPWHGVFVENNSSVSLGGNMDIFWRNTGSAPMSRHLSERRNTVCTSYLIIGLLITILGLSLILCGLFYAHQDVRSKPIILFWGCCV